MNRGTKLFLNTLRAKRRGAPEDNNSEGITDPEAAMTATDVKDIPLERTSNHHAATFSPQKRGTSHVGAQHRHVDLHDSADGILRGLGIIRQKARYGNKMEREQHARYDVWTDTWVDDSSGQPIVNPDYLKQIQSISHRVDTAPNGIVLVIGDVGDIPEGSDLSSPSAAAGIAVTGGPESAAEESSEALRGRIDDVLACLQLKLQTIQRTLATEEQENNKSNGFPVPVGQPLASAATVARCIAKVEKLNQSISQDRRLGGMLLVANMGEESDGQFLSQMEVMQTLRQFLYRSVPMAAAEVGALVITSTTGATRQLLSDGLQAASTAVDVSALLIEALPAPADSSSNGTAENPIRPAGYGRAGFSHCLTVGDESSRAGVSDESISLFTIGLTGELAAGRTELAQAAAVAAGSSSNNGRGGRRGGGKKREEEAKDGATPSIPFPDRPSVPVVVVACGGTQEASIRELLGPVSRGWSIFLLEGSGGYTDSLCTLVRVLQDDTIPLATRLLLRRSIDPGTLEIVERGRLIVVERGQVVDTFSQSLRYTLRGDETLKLAWEKHAGWTHLANSNRNLYRGMLIFLISLGILSTGLSVFQTVVQVIWPDDASQNAGTSIGVMYQAFNLTLIFLPLLIQLLQAVFNRLNAGSKWAACRWAAESCLREIFLCRVQGKDYSPAAVRAAARRVSENHRKQQVARMTALVADRDNPGDADNNAEAAGSGAEKEDPMLLYSTRQELLSMRLEYLSKELMTNIGNAPIEPYVGPIPIRKHLHPRDDGMSDLSTDDYYRFRVAPRKEYYRKRSHSVSTYRILVEAGVHLFNTTGTILGTLATYSMTQNMNLQAWVAFTTAVVSSLTRLEHWLLFEWQQRNYTQSHLKLNIVAGWWGSRGEHRGGDDTRNELCSRAEGVMLAELEEFCQQLRSASESIKRAAESKEDGTDTVEGAAGALAHRMLGEVSASVRAIERRVADIPLSFITPANIAKAKADPKSAVGRVMKRMLVDLNHEFGDVVGEKARRALELLPMIQSFEESPTTFDDIQHIVINSDGLISMPPQLRQFEFFRLLPAPVLEVARVPHKRVAFLRALDDVARRVDVTTLRLDQLGKLMSYVDVEVLHQLNKLPVRLKMEALRSILNKDALEQLIGTLVGAKIVVAEITPRKGKLVQTLQALRPIANSPWRLFDAETILMMIDDLDVRETLQRNLSEPRLRALLKRVEGVLVASSDALRLEQSIIREMVFLDLHNEILDTDEGRLATSEMRSRMRNIPVSAQLMSRQDLLLMFPLFVPPTLNTVVDLFSKGVNGQLLKPGAFPKYTTLRLQMEQVHHEVLAEYVVALGQRLPATVVARAALNCLPREYQVSLEPALVMERGLDELAVLLLKLSQLDIVGKRKEQLLKLLMSSTSGASDLVERLRGLSDNGLKMVLSSAHAALGNTFVGELYDKLSFETTSFSPIALLNFEEQTLLLSRISQFAKTKGDGGDDVLLENMSTQDILSRLSLNRLTKKLKELHGYQLQELVRTILAHVSTPLFHDQLLIGIRSERKLLHLYDFVAGLSPLQRIVMTHHLCRITEADFELVGRNASNSIDIQSSESATFEQMLQLISDGQVQSQVLRMGLSAEELRLLCRVAAQQNSDASAVELLRDVAVECQGEEEFIRRLQSVFSQSLVCQRILTSFTVLLTKRVKCWMSLEALLHAPAAEIIDIFREEQRRKKEALFSIGSDGAYTFLDVHQLLHREFGDAYNQVLVAVFGSVMARGPLYLFNEAARQFRSLNIRAIFLTMESRIGLVEFALKHADRIVRATAAADTAASPKRSTFSDTVRGGGAAPAAAAAASNRLMGILENERESDFAAAIEDLHLLSSEDVKGLLSTVVQVYNQSAIGFVLRHVATMSLQGGAAAVSPALGNRSDSGSRDGAFSEQQLMQQSVNNNNNSNGGSNNGGLLINHQIRWTIAVMSPYLKTSMMDVALHFDQFDAAVFTTKPLTQRLSILSRYVNHDGLAVALANWPKERYAQLFSYLRTRPRPGASSGWRLAARRGSTTTNDAMKQSSSSSALSRPHARTVVECSAFGQLLRKRAAMKDKRSPQRSARTDALPPPVLSFEGHPNAPELETPLSP